jgi:hypothetical protein
MTKKLQFLFLPFLLVFPPSVSADPASNAYTVESPSIFNLKSHVSPTGLHHSIKDAQGRLLAKAVHLNGIPSPSTDQATQHLAISLYSDSETNPKTLALTSQPGTSGLRYELAPVPGSEPNESSNEFSAPPISIVSTSHGRHFNVTQQGDQHLGVIRPASLWRKMQVNLSGTGSDHSQQSAQAMVLVGSFLSWKNQLQQLQLALASTGILSASGIAATRGIFNLPFQGSKKTPTKEFLENFRNAISSANAKAETHHQLPTKPVPSKKSRWKFWK